MKSIIDLHIHSCYSEDGEYTPATLVGMCAEAGIHMMAIADHNCVKATAEAMEEAKKYEIKYYAAVEIDCMHQGNLYHVLGYHIDHTSRDFEIIEQNVRKQCMAASKERLRLIKQHLKFDLKQEALIALTKGSYWPEHWTGEAMAEVLLEDPRFFKSPLLRPYRPGGERADNPYVNFYWDYCGPGQSCHVSMAFPEMAEVIEIIHQNKGQAVLAHGAVNTKGNLGLINTLVPLGLDGIEAFSSYHDRQTAQRLKEIAEKHNLIITYGSDFHGKTKPAISLGGCCKTA